MNDFFELSIIDSKGCEPVMERVDVNGMLTITVTLDIDNVKV